MFSELRMKIQEQIDFWEPILINFPTAVLYERRNSQNRTIKEILGHLIDSAVNNHHRIVRLQYKSNLTFPDYRQNNDRWIKIQNYQEEDWELMVSFWALYNLHMAHIIKNTNPECLSHTWHDFENTKETLNSIIEGYLWHLNLHLREIEELSSQL